jgi:DNA-binding IclR family transcriptional regulator
MTGSGPPVKATATSVSILEAVDERGGATLTELTEHVGLSKSSTHNHLATLEAEGLLVRDGWTYHPSLRFLELGVRARDRYRLYDVGRPDVRELASAAGLTAGLFVFERGECRCVYTATHGTRDDPAVRVGDALPLHCTAPGKATLNELSEETIEELLGEEFEACTENTVTTRAALNEELRAIRAQRLVFDRQEWQSGVHGVATAVTDGDGELLGTIGVLGTTDELSGKRLQQDVPGLVLSAANSIRKTVRSQ